MKPNSASVEREKSGQGTGTALQGEIGGLTKRGVDVSEMTTEPLGDQSTANGLHNPPSVFSSVFSGRWPATLELVWQTLEREQKMSAFGFFLLDFSFYWKGISLTYRLTLLLCVWRQHR